MLAAYLCAATYVSNCSLVGRSVIDISTEGYDTITNGATISEALLGTSSRREFVGSLGYAPSSHKGAIWAIAILQLVITYHGPRLLVHATRTPLLHTPAIHAIYFSDGVSFHFLALLFLRSVHVQHWFWVWELGC